MPRTRPAGSSETYTVALNPLGDRGASAPRYTDALKV